MPIWVADGYYASFDVLPVAYKGHYWTPCNTIVPPFGIKIGGTVFYLNSADLVVPNIAGRSGYTNSTTGEEFCRISIVPATSDQ